MTATTQPTPRQLAALRDCAITRRANAVIDAVVRKHADEARVELDKQAEKRGEV